MSKKSRNEQHDAHVAQDLINFAGLTHAAAMAEVAEAEAELVAEFVELSNEFRQQLADWRTTVAQFRERTRAAAAETAAAETPIEAHASAAAAAGDELEALVNPARPDKLPEPVPSVATIVSGDPVVKE